MTRVKRGVIANKRRKNYRKHAKGFKWDRKSKFAKMREALYHAWTYMYEHRRKKKGDFRRLWQIKINAAARANDTTYSKLIDMLKKNNIKLDRKILADLGENHKEVFKKIVERVK